MTRNLLGALFALAATALLVSALADFISRLSVPPPGSPGRLGQGGACGLITGSPADGPC
jgi:hypothetical protein